MSVWRETGALAVDLESAVVASAAEAARIPFLVLRAIADPATREVPSAALIPFSRDENSVLLRLMAELLRQPRQIAALLVLAFDTQRALMALAAPARALHQALTTADWGSSDSTEVGLACGTAIARTRVILGLGANRGRSDPNSSRADCSSTNLDHTPLPSDRQNDLRQSRTRWVSPISGGHVPRRSPKLPTLRLSLRLRAS